MSWGVPLDLMWVPASSKGLCGILLCEGNLEVSASVPGDEVLIAVLKVCLRVNGS